MKKSEIKELPEYYDHYINLNEDIELAQAFEKSITQIGHLDISKLKRIGLKVYAKGKWPIHKIIQHLTDWERIWCYRTIIFARGENTIPHGLDHELMSNNSNADNLPIEQLIAELRAVRLSTKAMFDSFSPRILNLNCKFYNSEMSVLAMGFNIIGHQLHHFDIIEERYFSLDIN